MATKTTVKTTQKKPAPKPSKTQLEKDVAYYKKNNAFPNRKLTRQEKIAIKQAVRNEKA